MEDIYAILGHPPCAEDIKHWAYRKSDDDDWLFEKNIRTKCHQFALPDALYELDSPSLTRRRRAAEDILTAGLLEFGGPVMQGIMAAGQILPAAYDATMKGIKEGIEKGREIAYDAVQTIGNELNNAIVAGQETFEAVKAGVSENFNSAEPILPQIQKFLFPDQNSHPFSAKKKTKTECMQQCYRMTITVHGPDNLKELLRDASGTVFKKVVCPLFSFELEVKPEIKSEIQPKKSCK